MIKPYRFSGYTATNINKLIKSHDNAFRPHHGQYDFYDYLEDVLRVYWEWKAKESLKEIKKKVRFLSGVRARRRRGALHTFIEASAKGADSKMKSRWVQALLFADKKRNVVERDGLKKFFRKHHGVAGAAREMAKLRKSKQSSGLSAKQKLQKIRNITMLGD
jgi:hypothetical protein